MKFSKFTTIFFVIFAATIALNSKTTVCKQINKIHKASSNQNNHNKNKITYRLLNDNSKKQIIKHENLNSNFYYLLARYG